MLFPFGYGSRHHFKYQTKTKCGCLVLWFPNDDTQLDFDPIVNQKWGTLAMQFNRYGGVGSRTEFPIGDEHDLLSILVSLVMVKNGKDHSFSNYQDRIISFSLYKAGEEQQKRIIVKIRYNSNIGILTLDEVNELEIVTRNILANLRYSKQEINEKLESMITQSSSQAN